MNIVREPYSLFLSTEIQYSSVFDSFKLNFTNTRAACVVNCAQCQFGEATSAHA